MSLMLNELISDKLLRITHTVMLSLGIFLVVRELFAGIGPNQQPLGRDFACFWSAGRMVLDGHILAIFDPQAMTKFQQVYLDGPQGQLAPWFYPPLLLLYISCVFALLPYKLAYFVYIVISVAAFYGVTRRLFPAIKPLYFLSFPAFWYNLVSGQNGLLTAIILVFGLLSLAKQPWLSGFVIALLSYKPQLCLAVPVFLLIERRWPTILAGSATLVALIGFSTAMWGSAIWPAFLNGLQAAQTYNQTGHMMPPHAFAHLYGSLKVLGFDHATAMAVNYMFAAALGCMAIRIWLLPYERSIKLAAVVLMTLLLPPHLIYYDFVVTGAAIAWLWPNENLRPTLILLWFAPFIWPPFGSLGIPLFSIAAALLFYQLTVLSLPNPIATK
jgi:alpha-1,2-mannosyltransferase